MNAQQPQTRDLDLWFVNKDTDGAVKPGPGRTGQGSSNMGRGSSDDSPGRGRQACPFDELADDFTRDRSSAIGVATVNHRDDLDDEAVFEDPVEDAVLASPC
jgi:hypothetical protein